MKHANLSAIKAFTSDDNTAIQELVGTTAAIPHQGFSVANTVIPSGTTATKHYHKHTEELYLITGGSGQVIVDDDVIEVSTGDTLLIAIGERHYAIANAEGPLEILAISVPAFDPDDFIECSS